MTVGRHERDSSYSTTMFMATNALGVRFFRYCYRFMERWELSSWTPPLWSFRQIFDVDI